MSPAPDLLMNYGLVVVFAWAFVVQEGAPAPALPMLLGAGALSGSGRMDLALAITAAMAATVSIGATKARLTERPFSAVPGHLAFPRSSPRDRTDNGEPARASKAPGYRCCSARCFPNRMRGAALAVSGATNWVANFAVTVTFLPLLTAVGLAGAYALYALAALVSLPFVWALVRETRGKTLEQMQG